MDIGEDEIKYAAKVTAGFSGREISKLAIAWQAAAYGATGDAILNKELYLRVLDQHLESKKKKQHWLDAAMASLPKGSEDGTKPSKLVIDSLPPSSSP